MTKKEFLLRHAKRNAPSRYSWRLQQRDPSAIAEDDDEIPQ